MRIDAHYVQDGKVYIEVGDHTYVWSGAKEGKLGLWLTCNPLSGTQESALLDDFYIDELPNKQWVYGYRLGAR